MSGIAGIYNLDGQPVDRDLLERMTTAIAHRGPDGTGYWVDGAVGFGHQMLCTTPESLHETQPLRDASGQLCLVMDGRVDNCAELRSALLARGAHPRDDTDAELVLCAYQVWGEECPKEIIGDFAFVIWDARKRQLFCARDFLGIKPFYYHFDGRTFRFASELHQILEDPAISREPNEGMVGEYLANAITSKEETLYLSIMRLPPSNSLIVRRGRFTKQLYWKPDFSKNIRYSSDEEYAEHFLEIFKEAVRCRMRSVGPVGIALSGGLDSSSVTCMAQSICQENGSVVPRLVAFSEIFPGMDYDESGFIEDVVQLWQMESHTVQRADIGLDFYSEQVSRYLDFPGYPNGGAPDPVNILMHDRAMRVLLDGLGGDEWLFGTSIYYVDLMSRLRIRELLWQLRYDVRTMSMKVMLSRLLWQGINPLFPQKIRNLVKLILNKKPKNPIWLENEFTHRIRLADRRQTRTPPASLKQRTRQNIWEEATTGFQTHVYELEERAATWSSFEQRHPFHDRRLVEYTLALPEEQRCRRGWIKYVLRLAMEDILPETVRQRWDKAEFSNLTGSSLQEKAIAGAFDNLAIAASGWVDSQAARNLYRNMSNLYIQNDRAYQQYTWELWTILGIELWYKKVFLNQETLSPLIQNDISSKTGSASVNI